MTFPKQDISNRTTDEVGASVCSTNLSLLTTDMAIGSMLASILTVVTVGLTSVFVDDVETVTKVTITGAAVTIAGASLVV